jgi:hypothetical protein
VTDPWAGSGCGAAEWWWAQPAEVEHGESDEGLGLAEPEGDAGQEPQFRIHALHPGIRQSVAERSVDAGTVVTDRAGHLHERGEPAAPGPRQLQFSQASSNAIPSAPLS